jgi:hypothetical protein
MNLKNIIAVSGLPGLYKLVATKNNGLIVSDLDNGKSKFCSIRQHQFTPMETVSLYTEEDTIPISDVFKRMLDSSETHAIPSVQDSHVKLQTYFETVVPEYDRDKVYHSDMKKVIKWYNFLNERGYLTQDPEEEVSDVEESA